MNLKNTAEDQMAYSLSWIAVLVFFWACASFSGYGFLSILITSLVLISSAVLFALSKEKQVLASKQVLVYESLISEEDNPSPQVEEDILVSKHQPQSEDSDACLAIRPLDSNSETGSIDHSSTSEDSDIYWPYSGDVGPTPDCSDGSISDEESLIEIALPSGHYVSPQEEDPKLNVQQKMPNLSQETIFGQHGLMELLAEINEMNEEENLIEIDISVGSIKCSRFEIEA